MNPTQITLLYEPPRQAPGPLQAGPERYDRLAAELARHVRVERATGQLRDFAGDGFILLHSELDPCQVLAECPAARRQHLAARLVPLDVSRSGIFELLEALALPAAVTGLALWEWEAGDAPGASGLHGLKAIGAKIGAASDALSAAKSARYGCLESATHDGLPHLLADYLRAYAEAMS